MVLWVLVAGCPGAGVIAERPGVPAEVRTAGGFAYRAETALLPGPVREIRAGATMMNAGRRERTVEFPDGCEALLRVYRTPDRIGPPAWDQGRAVVCTLALQLVDFAPGEPRFYFTSAAVPEILGDSLPPGRYHFSVYLRPDGSEVEVPAGEGDLRP